MRMQLDSYHMESISEVTLTAKTCLCPYNKAYDNTKKAFSSSLKYTPSVVLYLTAN